MSIYGGMFTNKAGRMLISEEATTYYEMQPWTTIPGTPQRQDVTGLHDFDWMGMFGPSPPITSGPGDDIMRCLNYYVVVIMPVGITTPPILFMRAAGQPQADPTALRDLVLYYRTTSGDAWAGSSTWEEAVKDGTSVGTTTVGGIKLLEAPPDKSWVWQFPIRHYYGDPQTGNWNWFPGFEFKAFCQINQQNAQWWTKNGMELYAGDGSLRFTTRIQTAFFTGKIMKIATAGKIQYPYQICDPGGMAPCSTIFNIPWDTSLPAAPANPWFSIVSNTGVCASGPSQILNHERDGGSWVSSGYDEAELETPSATFSGGVSPYIGQGDGFIRVVGGYVPYEASRQAGMQYYTPSGGLTGGIFGGGGGVSNYGVTSSPDTVLDAHNDFVMFLAP
jgi:hypothetical protein